MYLISYDISNDRLRNKVAKLLEDYGKRVQYSVFECHISDKQFYKLREELVVLMAGSEHTGIRIYRLCKKCEKIIQMIGDAYGLIDSKITNYEDDVFII